MVGLSVEVKRATFEEVNKSQLEFIFYVIQEAIEKKDYVDKKSRRSYFDLFAFALLGKSVSHDFIFEYKGGKYNLGSLSTFARKMSFFDEKEPMIDLKGKKECVPIELLWVALRDNLYDPMDEALTLALKSSPERINSGGGSYSFRPEDPEGKNNK